MSKELRAEYILGTAGIARGVAEADKQMSELDKRGAELGESFDAHTDRIGGAFTRLGNTMAGLGVPFAESFQRIGEDLEKAKSDGGSYGKVLQDVGKVAAVGLAGGLAAAGAESVHLAEKYQQSVASMAAQAGIPVAAAQKIGDAFLGTAGKTTFSAQEIAAAYGPVAGQLATVEGHALDSGEALSAMQASMDLAEASGGDLSSTTASLASVMQAFGIQTSGAAGASDVLFNSATKTGLGVAQTAASFQKMRTQLGAAAPPLSEMGGLLVDLTEHGETGRAAMSILSGSLSGILKPSKAVTAAQHEMGVSFTDSHGNLLPLSEIIGEAHDKIAGMGNAQAVATLQSLGFGSSALKLLPVIQAGSSAFDAATASVSKTGSAQSAAEKQADTLKGQTERLKSEMEDYGVKLGEYLIPMLDKTMQYTADIVSWFSKHKDAAIALAAVIAGPLSVAVGAFAVNKIGGMIKSVQDAGKALSGLASGVQSVAGKLSGSFSGIAGDADQMATDVEGSAGDMQAGVEGKADQMAAGVEAKTAQMGNAATRDAKTMAQGVEGDASNMASGTEFKAAQMADGVGDQTGIMSKTATKNAETMAAGVEGSTAEMAAGVEGEVTGMTSTVETEMATMATDAEGSAAATDAATGSAETAAAGLGSASTALAAGGAGIAELAGYGIASGADPNLASGNTLFSGYDNNGKWVTTPGSQSASSPGFNFSNPNLANAGQAASLLQGLNIPKAGKGGLVSKPTLVMVGEAGGTEAIVPLDGVSLDQPGGLPAGLGRGAASGNVYTVTVNVLGPSLDGQAVARAITPAIRQELLDISHTSGTSGAYL